MVSKSDLPFGIFRKAMSPTPFRSNNYGFFKIYLLKKISPGVRYISQPVHVPCKILHSTQAGQSALCFLHFLDHYFTSLFVKSDAVKHHITAAIIFQVLKIPSISDLFDCSFTGFIQSQCFL